MHSGPDRFPEFWAAYPRRVGKATARKAWDKALGQPGVNADMIIAGAWRLAQDPNRVDRYTPHPTTWINREGWTDAPEPPREDPRSQRRSTVDDKIAGWAALKHPQTTAAPTVIDAEWTDTTTDRRAIR
ncbi:hypothetical protein GQ85_19825 [Rhodococcus rhodochrous]|nr:hypothetical protein GQ85_19825 [Rhodococcus rhodochrous]